MGTAGRLDVTIFKTRLAAAWELRGQGKAGLERWDGNHSERTNQTGVGSMPNAAQSKAHERRRCAYTGGITNYHHYSIETARCSMLAAEQAIESLLLTLTSVRK